MTNKQSRRQREDMKIAPGEINVTIHRGLVKVVAEVPLVVGREGLEDFVEEIEKNVLGYNRLRSAAVINISPGEPRPDKSGIPKTGLLSKKQVLEILGISRSTLDQRIASGKFPRGGKYGGLRKWDASEIWSITEKIARQTDEPKDAPWLKNAKPKSAA
jgi:predicted DNA-binding transcriptional regulator AlpA